MTHGEDAGQDGYSGVFFGDAPGVKLVDPSSFLVELTLLKEVQVVFNSGGSPCTDDAPFFGQRSRDRLVHCAVHFPTRFCGCERPALDLTVGWKLRVKLLCKIATLSWGNVIRNVVQDFSR